MKGLTVLLLLMLPVCSYPQGVFTNSTHSALQKVINDYPKFVNIRGSIVNQEAHSADYSSSVQVPGSVNTTITRYSSADKDEIYSWKSVLFETEDFDEASARYKELFKQISNSIIKIDGQKPLILNGSYSAPTDEKRFISSSFQLVPAAPGVLKKLKVELTMEFLVIEWKLSLLVYDQEEAELVME